MPKQDNGRVEQLIRKAGGVLGKTQDSTKTLHHKWTTNKLMASYKTAYNRSGRRL